MKTEIEQIQLLLEQFRRPTPQGEEYQNRLAEEFEIILQQRFTDYFLKIRLILDLNEDIPHMTRGSPKGLAVRLAASVLRPYVYIHIDPKGPLKGWGPKGSFRLRQEQEEQEEADHPPPC